MTTKWTEERRRKFKATMAARKKQNGHLTEHLPPELEKALYAHYRNRVLRELLSRY